MQQVLVYADSLSWGIVPNTRRRLPFDARWPGVMENVLNAASTESISTLTSTRCSVALSPRSSVRCSLQPRCPARVVRSSSAEGESP
jgi:lysophospholipase L1-like esterase